MGTPRRRIRSWTDAQLSTAVAEQRSWRGVARALGLRPTATNNLRRHVARLRLDTTHFTGRRQWTDQQLRSAVKHASTWAEVLLRLGVEDTGEARVRAKGHSVRLGLDLSHLAPVSRIPLPAEVGSLAPKREMLRTAAVSIAASWFALRGLATAVPAEPQEYDLLVTFPAGIQRVQVKSTTRRIASGSWLVKVARRPYSLDKTAGRLPYDPNSLDYFFVVAGDGGLYLIPSRVLAGRLEVCVDTYAEYRVGDASSLLT